MQKPLHYDWQRNEKRVSICVDLDFHTPEARNNFDWCVEVLVFPPTKKRLALILQNPVRKLNKAAKNCRLVATEAPESGEYTRYIWYGDNEAGANDIKAFCEAQTACEMRCSVKLDAKQKIYEDAFYPTEAAWQTLRNADILELRAREGDNPARPRPVKHTLVFFDDYFRQLFREAARQAGFAIEDTYFDSENAKPCAITLRHISAMNKPELDTATTTLITLAQKYNGDYVGWDAAMHRKVVKR